MRTKLLRALAHLKAAKRHLDAARSLTNLDFCRPLAVTNAVNGAIAAAEGARVEVGARYAKIVFDAIEPAELP